jgi:hypothetical protein
MPALRIQDFQHALIDAIRDEKTVHLHGSHLSHVMRSITAAVSAILYTMYAATGDKLHSSAVGLLPLCPSLR